MVLGIPNFKKTTYLCAPLSFFKGQRPSVSMRRAGQKVSVSYSLTSSSRGWDAPLGWENLSSISRPILYFAPQHTVNRTMCRFRFPRARQSVSMCRAGPKVSVSYSLTSSSTRVGCTAGLGELEQQIAAHSILAPQHTVNRTMCRFRFPMARDHLFLCAGLIGKSLSAAHWLPILFCLPLHCANMCLGI